MSDSYSSLRRLVCIIFAVFFATDPLQAAPVEQRVVPGRELRGIFPSGTKFLYAVPEKGWNGDLILFAHGYTAFNEPLALQNLSFGDFYLPELAQRLGFAFGATSYRQTGLAIKEGVYDMIELAAYFAPVMGKTPRRIFLVGASEGGIVTALTLEQFPQFFAGGLSMCGPIGDFERQLDYVGDFRVAFDAMFPGVLPGNAFPVNESLIDNWYSTYEGVVANLVAANPSRIRELLAVTRAPFDRNDASTIENTVLGVLWYQIFGSNDAGGKLGGNPFENRRRVYRGSSNDAQLNADAERYAASPVALREVRSYYNTTGKLRRPLVTLHTTGDEIIPFWHEVLYFQKVRSQGTGRHLKLIPVPRYGHCNFTAGEVVGAFFLMLREAE